MAKSNKKSPKESSKTAHDKIEASASQIPQKREPKDVKQEIINAIKSNHSEEIRKGEPVINTYEGVYGLLPHLHPEEINMALAQMNSVKIIDGLAGSLEFFPTLF